MSSISKVLFDDDIVDKTSLYEIAADVFYLSQYRKIEGNFAMKNEYIRKRDEFIKKVETKYPLISDEEIFNFIRIYLLYEPAEINQEKSDFLFDGRIPLNRICWMGPYLQEKGDYRYCWVIESMG